MGVGDEAFELGQTCVHLEVCQEHFVTGKVKNIERGHEGYEKVL